MKFWSISQDLILILNDNSSHLWRIIIDNNIDDIVLSIMGVPLISR